MKLKYILILILIFMISLALWPLFARRYLYVVRDDGNALQIIETNSRMEKFADFIQLITFDLKKKQLPKDMKELLEYLYKEDIGIEELYERSNWIDPNTKELVDAWRNPIHLEVKSDDEYIFISNGLNRKFENGQGDDITYSFNPYEFKEKDK